MANSDPASRRGIAKVELQFGKEEAVGTSIGFPLRRKDIADIAGTTLYSLSRALTNGEKRGLLITRGRDRTQDSGSTRDR